jgi:hypothetical protein
LQVVLNRRDKEQLVIKLHQEGKTIREIASSAYMSFGDIGKIINRIDGRDNDDRVEGKINIKNKSKDTQLCFYFQTEKNLLRLR